MFFDLVKLRRLCSIHMTIKLYICDVLLSSNVRVSKERRSPLFTDRKISTVCLVCGGKTLNSNLELCPIKKERGILYTSTRTHTTQRKMSGRTNLQT